MGGVLLGLSPDSLWLTGLLIASCILVVAAFASSEAAILAANPLRMEYLAAAGDKRAQAFCELRAQESKMLATILAVENLLIILTVVSVILLAENLLETSLPHVSLLSLVFVPFGLQWVLVLFGQITPKTYATRHATRMALLVARPLNALVKALYPLLHIVFVWPSNQLISGLDHLFGSREEQPSVTEAELHLLLERSSQEGVLVQEERNLIQNVFEFGNTVVAEVMTSRTHMVAFEQHRPIAEVVAEMLDSGFSRFPIYSESIDEIQGLVHIKELCKAHYTRPEEQLTLADLCRPTLFVPKDKPVLPLLELMQKDAIRLVIVADPYGGTEGLLTLKDLMREVLGDPDSAASLEQAVKQVAPGLYRVQGQTSIYDLSAKLGLSFPEGKYQTLAGFALDQLGHIPQSGESFRYSHWELTVTQVSGPKIIELELRQSGQHTAELQWTPPENG